MKLCCAYRRQRESRTHGPRLLGLADPLKGSTFPLLQARFSIGRESSNQLSIDDNTVSRRHCVLEKTTDGFMVRDLGSRAGTLVNGTVTAQALLQHGDRIGVGESAFLYMAGTDEPVLPTVALLGLRDQVLGGNST